jgi:translocation and assembly module TamB
MRWRLVATGGLLLLIGVAVLLHRLLYTPLGLEILLSQLDRLQKVRVEVSGARGVLAGPLSFDRVVVDHEAVRVEALDVRGEPVLPGLRGGTIALERAEIGRVRVTIKDRGPQPETPIHFLPAWLSIVAREVTMRDVGVVLQNGVHLQVASVRGALRLTRWRLDVDPFTLEDPAGRLSGQVFLRAKQPLGLRGEISGRWQLPDEHLYRFTARARGDLARLGTDVTLTEPAKLAFSGNALDLKDQARLVGTLRVTAFDGSPWVPAGRLPALSGSVSIDARREGIGLDGTLTSPTFGAEPVRVHGGGRYADRQVDIVSLRAWLPRTGLSLATAGSVRFAEHAPELDLEGEWTAFRWPLAGETLVESPAGTYRLEGPLPYAFEVEAAARGPEIPAADFTAAGSIDRERLVIDRVDGTVIGGRLAGSGQFSWTGEEFWSAQVSGRSLDVGALRPDLAGRVDVVGSIEGKGYAANAPWTARLERLTGTLKGRPLTGRGVITHRDGTYALEKVRLSHAGSHVDLDGSWGNTVDLRWSADVRSLALLHPDLDGSLVSTGTARGSAGRPHVSGEARLREVRFGSITADSLSADVDVDLADRRDSRVDVRAETMSAAGLQFDSARLQASGLTSAHEISLTTVRPDDEERQIPGVRARLSARGGYDFADHAWRGALDEATFAFRDGSAKLLKPAALELSPSLAKSAPLCLGTGDARLCAEGEWRSGPGSWRVLYSAQDWPLERLLRTLLGRRDFDGRLQASGWAEQQPGHPWVGAATVLIDEPTFDIRRNKFRTERVALGGGRLDLFADERQIRIDTDLQMAASTRLQGHVTAHRLPGQAITEHPLSGDILAESSVLTALPLFVPEIDRSEGRLDGAIRVTGTLGDPEFDGEFHVRDGRFDLYRTNLALSAVSLDGRFAGDTLEFDGSGKTREGPVTLRGRFSWPDNVMTGSLRLTGENLLVADTPEFRILASPDLTLAADASGYVVTGEVLVPSALIAPKDLSTSVSTSDDERLVGAEVEETGETGTSTLERVRSTVRVRLGDDVRVDSYGLKARLDGQVTVKTRPGDVARGNGAIRIVKGEYKAFGVFVEITRGVLSYQDTPLTEPTLDLVARRDIKDADVEVSVNVRGQLDNPFVTLSSDPAMPNNEALSYLLTGRSINTLQSNEAASVKRAAESLAISGGGLLLGGLGSRLGLDEVTVENTGEDDTSVVLGKFLSPKLFVSYGISIAEAINTIKLRYTLNRRWSLKAEAGLEQSADVEYRIER